MLTCWLVSGAGVLLLLFWVAYLYALLRVAQRFTRVVVGRSLHALHARGVPRLRALELVAPELRDEYRRWAQRQVGRG
jgi:hypothetical protein